MENSTKRQIAVDQLFYDPYQCAISNQFIPEIYKNIVLRVLAFSPHGPMFIEIQILPVSATSAWILLVSESFALPSPVRHGTCAISEKKVIHLLEAWSLKDPPFLDGQIEMGTINKWTIYYSNTSIKLYKYSQVKNLKSKNSIWWLKRVPC